MTLPKLSIAAKLYAIFALMATTTVVLSVVAVMSARTHAAMTQKFQSVSAIAVDVERASALVHAAYSSSRALLAAPDRDTAARYTEEMSQSSASLGMAVERWWESGDAADEETFSKLSAKMAGFRAYLNALGYVAADEGVAAARAWAGTNSIFDARGALTGDLETLGHLYTERAQKLYAALDADIGRTTLWLSGLAGLAVLLALAGIAMIARGVARPLAAITRVTQSVAGGDAAIVVPFSGRHDEIGALARSIGVFQRAMNHNTELNRTVLDDADARSRRQEVMSAEIARFSAEVESTLSELAGISERMLASSSQLASAADHAAARTDSAAAASAEASANVRDIASAADELSASVNEIDRQVAQSSAIAGKAVAEAGRTNLAVKELDEAATRIGDVVKLITDIAAQTNLLALNATIEAARAGEAGRGFAVVAGEVKALAGQTSRATGEIGAQIAGMQRATERSIAAIEAIETIIREMGDISGAIAAAVTQQGAATSEIARSVDIAAQRTSETADEVSLVEQAANDTRSNAGVVRNVAGDLGQVAGRIRSQVDQFFDRLSA